MKVVFSVKKFVNHKKHGLHPEYTAGEKPDGAVIEGAASTAEISAPRAGTADTTRKTTKNA